MNKPPQGGVAAQNSQQQPTQQQGQDGATIQLQLTHDGSEQMQGTQVASSNTSMNSTSTMVMAAPQQTLISQQAMPNLQNPPTIAPMPSQGGATTITTMSTGPQQMADWSGHGRVQVIQQPIQNPTYIQPVYNAQGQLIVPGNIAVHPGDMNQPIQVIAAGKAFQPGQMSHMLTTTQGKPIVQGQATSFPGYATIPTSGSNPTLLISQLGVLGQTNLLPQQQGKPQNVQKMITKTNVTNNMKTTPAQQQNVSIGNLVSSQPQTITTQAQAIIQPQIISPIQYTCNTQQQRAVPQGATQTMQFAPWQATFGPTGLPQGLTWAPGAIQSSALLTQGSQIFIRNPQQEQQGMFIHNTQPSAVPQHNQIAGQQLNKPNQAVEVGGNAQSKTAIPKTFSTILPNSISPQQLRPASSVSTQTGQTQNTVNQTIQIRAGPKVRTKNVCRMPSVSSTQKSDAGNQTKASPGAQASQQKPTASSPVPQENKPNKNASVTQAQPQPPLTQIQQMQNLFQDSPDQKGQVIVGNGIPNAGERGAVPVMSLSTGQMTPIVGNMIVQAVPGTIPGELLTTSAADSVAPALKQETENQKESAGQENGGMEAEAEPEPEPEPEPGRSIDENTSSSEESLGMKLIRSHLESDDSYLDERDDEKKLDGSIPGQKATMMVKPQVLTHVIEGFVIQESSEPFPVSRPLTDGLMRKMPVAEAGGSGEPPAKKSHVEEETAGPSGSEETRVNPYNWTVAEVCEFIRSLPGCADYVEDFAMQDIDGEALMLLRADHLMSAMSMKLGPAVKIIAKIDAMRGNGSGSNGA